jgi:hypothetical protein
MAALANTESLTKANRRSQLRHPFLNVCVDSDALAFKPTCAPTPISSEELDHSTQVSVRSAAQRQLAAGIDRSVTFARLHLMQGPDGSAHLFLLCDHLALDAKSLVIWLTDVMASLATATPPEQQEAEEETEEAHEFVEWSARAPHDLLKTLPPFSPSAPSVMLDKLTPTAEECAAQPPCNVADVCVYVDSSIFEALRAVTKQVKGTTLNAPLSAAFAAATADVARWQRPAAGQVVPPLTVQGACAVEVRQQCSPSLPADYMNNSAGIAVTAALFEEGADLWDVALASQANLLEEIAAGGAWRLQDITKRAAFAEMGPIFSIPALWSNIGYIGASGVSSCELHMAGAATNPVISGHCMAVSKSMSLTVTYSPLFYKAETADYLAQRFLFHVEALSTGQACPFWN